MCKYNRKGKSITSASLWVMLLTFQVGCAFWPSPGCRYACPGLGTGWAFSPLFCLALTMTNNHHSKLRKSLKTGFSVSDALKSDRWSRSRHPTTPKNTCCLHSGERTFCFRPSLQTSQSVAQVGQKNFFHLGKKSITLPLTMRCSAINYMQLYR